MLCPSAPQALEKALKEQDAVKAQARVLNLEVTHLRSELEIARHLSAPRHRTSPTSAAAGDVDTPAAADAAVTGDSEGPEGEGACVAWLDMLRWWQCRGLCLSCVYVIVMQRWAGGCAGGTRW